MWVDKRLLVPHKPGKRAERGVFCFIAYGQEVTDMLAGRYGREGLCLKVFKEPLDGRDPEALRWGKPGRGMPLGQATRAQNLFARHGLAPRIYDLVTVSDTYAAQVTDYAQDDGGTFDKEAALAVRKEYGVRPMSHDPNQHNWVGSKMVDFQYYRLPGDYPDRLRELAYKHAAWGSRAEPYQPVPELGLPGQRDPARQFAVLKLDGEDWRGMTALDIGCNLGALGRWLTGRGLRRYTGVDLPHVAGVAFEVNNWLGYWNLDFVGLRLPAERKKLDGSYDAVFCLSCQQAKPLPWAAGLAGELFYLEGHVPDKEATYRPALEELFARVEFLGVSRDHGPRPVFRCTL